LIINDSEAKQLAGVDNLFSAAKIIQAMGPKILVIKKGEHGSVLVYKNNYFFCPAYPIEQLFDPTGAGDTFAGGFVGYLARCGKIDECHLRQAIVYATCFASFCVEAFSVERLKQITRKDVQVRIKKLVQWMHIDSNFTRI
jgi:sugar/nucleoside kinase (ribokinase family)